MEKNKKLKFIWITELYWLVFRHTHFLPPVFSKILSSAIKPLNYWSAFFFFLPISPISSISKPLSSFFRLLLTQLLTLLSAYELAFCFRWSHLTSDFSLPDCKLISILISTSIPSLWVSGDSPCLQPFCFHLYSWLLNFSHLLRDLGPSVYFYSSLTTFS